MAAQDHPSFLVSSSADPAPASGEENDEKRREGL
jgi:hypothetical protein